MDVGCNIGDLRACECEFRHSTLPPIQQDRSDRFAPLIFENKLRSQQIGSVITTTRVGTVAKTAVHVEQHLPACDGFAIGDWSLRIGDETAAAPCSSRRLWILRL